MHYAFQPYCCSKDFHLSSELGVHGPNIKAVKKDKLEFTPRTCQYFKDLNVKQIKTQYTHTHTAPPAKMKKAALTPEALTLTFSILEKLELIIKD